MNDIAKVIDVERFWPGPGIIQPLLLTPIYNYHLHHRQSLIRLLSPLVANDLDWAT